MHWKQPIGFCSSDNFERMFKIKKNQDLFLMHLFPLTVAVKQRAWHFCFSLQGVPAWGHTPSADCAGSRIGSMSNDPLFHVKFSVGMPSFMTGLPGTFLSGLGAFHSKPCLWIAFRFVWQVFQWCGLDECDKDHNHVSAVELLLLSSQVEVSLAGFFFGWQVVGSSCLK